MAMNRETIEQEIGKRFEKIEKTLERTLEKTLEKAIGKAAEFANSPAGVRAQAVAEKAQERYSTARKSLDDVLLGLEHKGYNVKEPRDLIHTVGHRVLERASEIAVDVRTQVAAQPYSPEWLKSVTEAAVTQVQKRAEAASAAPLKTAQGASEATVETTVAAKGKSKTSATAKTAAGATEGDASLAADGEAAESAEDSKEERAAGTVVHSEPEVVTTSLAEASKSDQAADFATAGKTASSKKSMKAQGKPKK